MPILAVQSLVLFTGNNGNGDDEIAAEEEHSDRFIGGDISAHTAPPTSRLAYYWDRHRGQVLGRTTIELVQASWRDKTERDYSYKWNRWIRYCRSSGISEASPALGEALNFLSHLYEIGLKWRTIGGYRSMLSMTLPMYDGVPFGEHPLSSRLVKGVFNKRPPIKELFPSWSVKLVLDKLESWSAAKYLDLKDLTFKTIFLLAVCSAKRMDSISLLTIKKGYCEVNEFQARLQPLGLEKESRPTHIAPPIVLKAYAENRKLCPVFYLKTYIKRTSYLRQNESLFISF